MAANPDGELHAALVVDGHVHLEAGCCQAGKGGVGPDQHQVRTWDSWHRYTTLAMFVHAILARRARTSPPPQSRPDAGFLKCQRNPAPIRQLITTVIRSVSYGCTGQPGAADTSAPP